VKESERTRPSETGLAGLVVVGAQGKMNNVELTQEDSYTLSL